MEKLSLILIFIGLSVFIFSLWSFLSIKKHLKQFKNNYKFSSSLTDEKYFELKSRQEYIIAISAVIFSIISFIGYTSIDNIRKDISKQLDQEKEKINITYDSANQNLSGLEIRGKTVQDTLRSALERLAMLNRGIKALYNKDVINQNIFIVDPLRFNDYSLIDKKNGIREVKFKDLRTVSGDKLPIFKSPPSIICFSISNSSSLAVSKVTTDGFQIGFPRSYAIVTEDAPSDPQDIKFSVWISQKPPEKRDFDESFSNDFK